MDYMYLKVTVSFRVLIFDISADLHKKVQNLKMIL